MGWGSSYFSNHSLSGDLNELNMALGDLTNSLPDILYSEGNVGPSQVCILKALTFSVELKLLSYIVIAY